MTSDEAGRSEGNESLGSKSHCLHKRVIENHYDEQGNRTGKFICKECAAIIPDPSDSRS